MKFKRIVITSLSLQIFISCGKKKNVKSLEEQFQEFTEKNDEELNKNLNFNNDLLEGANNLKYKIIFSDLNCNEFKILSKNVLNEYENFKNDMIKRSHLEFQYLKIAALDALIYHEKYLINIILESKFSKCKKSIGYRYRN